MKRVQTIVSSLAALSPARASTAWGRQRPRCEEFPCATTSRYAGAGTEPSLDELLADPVVWQRARADGLDLADLRRVLVAAQQR